MWRYYWNWRNSVEDYKTIDIKFLKIYWYLDKWVDIKSWWLYWKRNWQNNWNIWIEVNKWENTWYLRVTFSQTNYNSEKRKLDYKIPLVSTSCNYWWIRWWFLCPCRWNRCSILYLQSNWIFASRKTLNLCYKSQKESKLARFYWKYLFSNYEKIEELKRTIKYPFRNWKPTRKIIRLMKLENNIPSLDEMARMEDKLIKEEQDFYVNKYGSFKNDVYKKVWWDWMYEWDYWHKYFKDEFKKEIINEIKTKKTWKNKEIKYNKEDEDIVDDIFRAWEANNSTIKWHWGVRKIYNQDFYKLKTYYIKSAIDKILKRKANNIKVGKKGNVIYFNIDWRQVSFHDPFNEIDLPINNDIEWIWKITRTNPLKMNNKDYLEYFWKFIK